MKTVLNVKTDKEVKERAQELAKYLGVPLSTVVNAYLKEFVHSGEFRLSREPEIRPEVKNELRTIHADVIARKNLSPTFGNAKDAIAWLEK